MGGSSALTRDVAMVGDRSHDVLGARACGVAAVGALWGYGSRAELSEAGAHALAAEPAELASALDECVDHAGPFFLDVRVAAQENCFPMIPAGSGHHRMMLSESEWYEEPGPESEPPCFNRPPACCEGR